LLQNEKQGPIGFVSDHRPSLDKQKWKEEAQVPRALLLPNEPPSSVSETFNLKEVTKTEKSKSKNNQ
jgi:hypothetical protein